MRQLKENNANELDVKVAVNELKKRKKILQDKELEMLPAVSHSIKIESLQLIRILSIVGRQFRSSCNGRCSQATIFL